LALDLLEEFRAPLVDRLVAAQWNLHVVKSSHFVAEPKGWRLKPAALKRFLQAYDVAVSKPFKEARDGKIVTFRKLFLIQARRLAAAVRDGAGTYVPYRHR
jgi:CRISPR-associated protein Cas1